jgi:hypothetical protein
LETRGFRRFWAKGRAGGKNAGATSALPGRNSRWLLRQAFTDAYLANEQLRLERTGCGPPRLGVCGLLKSDSRIPPRGSAPGLFTITASETASDQAAPLPRLQQRPPKGLFRDGRDRFT